MNEELKKSCLEFKANPVYGGAKWEDITSYSRNTQEKIPTIWQTSIGGLKIVLCCSHVIYKDTWIFSCDGLNIDNYPLSQPDAYSAALHSIRMCKAKIDTLYRAFEHMG